MTKSNSVAFAIFVKTPQLSPIKTRLAKDVGQNLALQFYEDALKTISKNLLKLKKNNPSIDIYWAVAESPSAIHDSYWNDFPVLHQSPGDLGVRLHSIYSMLKIEKNYNRVILLGADSPQMTLDDYSTWASIKKNTDTLLGPCIDGGFYCFIGDIAIPSQVWTAVTYSTNNTLHELKKTLVQSNLSYFELEPSYDIDTAQDLNQLNKSWRKDEAL